MFSDTKSFDQNERTVNNNVILIGMPASGKSTVGVILAKLLSYDFIDTDLIIQRREGLPLSKIIETGGIKEFLRVEEAACLNLHADHSVIATGGSVIYSEAAMKHFKSTGHVIFLDVDYEALTRRLHDIRTRGVVLPKGQSLLELYKERLALYNRYADIVVQEGQLSLEETVYVVYDSVKKRM